MDVDHCLRLLQSASSDNDKMAALMLVAKLVKSDEIGPEGRKLVFKTVGFSFINRLFATNKVPADCVENPYHKIAVTILACFCTDQDMIIHPQVTSKIPHFNNFVQEKCCEQSSLAEDSLQCLRALSCSPEGIHHLMKHHTMSALARAYITQNTVSDVAKDTLLGLLGQVFIQRLDNVAGVLDVLAILASKFRFCQEGLVRYTHAGQAQEHMDSALAPHAACLNLPQLCPLLITRKDQLKFDMCDTLCSVLRLSGHLCSADDASMKDISIGLSDIFCSKIDPQRRESALHLSAIMCEVFGLEWALHTDPETKFLLLWLRLVALEVRLAVDGNGFDVIIGRSSLLCSSFVILEATIVFVSKHSDQDEKGLLSSEFLLQLHTVLNEAFSSILYLLNVVANQSSEGTSVFAVPAADTTKLASTAMEYPIIAASVRVLGAWLAEDSLTLAEEVYKLLPFLLELASASVPQEGNEDLLKFLLPGLCHMTADDKARPLLMIAGLDKILEVYMHKLWPLAKQSSEMRDRFCLCCGILQNICVSSPEDVKKSEVPFGSIASLMTEVFAEYSGESVIGMNAIVLFVMINRRGDCVIVDERLSSWGLVFKALMTPVSGSRVAASVEDEISELRFIGTEELSTLVENCESLKKDASHWTLGSSK